MNNISETPKKSNQVAPALVPEDGRIVRVPGRGEIVPGRSSPFGRAVLMAHRAIAAREKALIRGARVASEIEPEKIDWLWDKWLPKGVVTLLFGKPKCGKGLLLTDVAARVTKGAAMPDGSAGRKGRVLWVESEDPVSSVLVPRFIAAGANRELIEIWDQTLKPIDYRRLATDLEKAAGQFELIVLSALKDTLPDVEKRRDADQEIRAAMGIISGVAQQSGCAVVGIGHTNKKPNLAGTERFSGFGAYTQFARQIVFACLENEDEKDGPRRLSHTGGNLAEAPGDMLFEPVARGDSVGLTWRAADYSQTTAELFGERSGGRGPQIEAWLNAQLGGGPKPKAAVIDAGKAKGYPPRTVERVFGKGREAGVYASDVSGYGPAKEAIWSLAAPPTDGERGGNGGNGGNGE